MERNRAIPQQYANISFQTRVQFLYEVLEKKKSIAKASKSFGICLSTAKLIVRKFKDSGQIFRKGMTRLKTSGQIDEKRPIPYPKDHNNHAFKQQTILQHNMQDQPINKASKDQTINLTSQIINRQGSYFIYYPLINMYSLSLPYL